MDEAGSRYRVHVCLGPNCTRRGSPALLTALEQRVRDAGLAREVEVLGTTCRNRCDYGPSINVYPGPVFYNGVTEDDLDELVGTHFRDGAVVERLRFREPGRQQERRRRW